MSKHTTGFLYLILLFIWPNIYGQKSYLFDQLTVNEGLSQNTVNRVFKDSQGFIWVATNDGLNRYDGYHFKKYRFNSDDSTTLSNNRVEALCEDKSGNLWVGTRGGLNRYDRASDHFIRYSLRNNGDESTPNSFIRALLSDREDNLWIGTMGEGLNLLMPGSDEILKINPTTSGPAENIDEDMNISDIFMDSGGAIWVATSSPGINRFDPDAQSFEFYPIAALYEEGVLQQFDKTIYQDSEGLFWICTMGAGIFQFDPLTGHFKRYFSGDYRASLRKDIVKDVIEYEGLIWIATDGGGLHIYDKETDHFEVLKMNPERPGSMNSEAIYSLYCDDQDILWVGTFNGGINKYDPNLQKFNHVQPIPGEKNSLSHPSVLCFEEDASGRIYVGTDGGGLNLFDPVQGTFRQICSDPDLPNCLNSKAITSIYRDHQNRIWVGTYSGGLHLYDPETGVKSKYVRDPADPLSLLNNNVWTILQDDHEEFWIGTSDGLQRFNPSTGQFFTIHRTSRPEVGFQNRVTAICEDRSGQLWFCGEELYRLNPSRDSLIDFIFPPPMQEQLKNTVFRSL